MGLLVCGWIPELCGESLIFVSGGQRLRDYLFWENRDLGDILWLVGLGTILLALFMIRMIMD